MTGVASPQPRAAAPMTGVASPQPRAAAPMTGVASPPQPRLRAPSRLHGRCGGIVAHRRFQKDLETTCPRRAMDARMQEHRLHVSVAVDNPLLLCA